MKLSRKLGPLSAIAVAAAVLAACASSTPYQPADKSGRGFSEQRIEGNRYRVTFEGNSSTDLETVGNYLLFRAAEVTVQRGFDHFVVADRVLDERTFTRYTYTGFGSPFGFYHNGFGRFGGPGFGGAGFAGGGFVDGYARERTSYKAIADILMFSGDKDARDAAAYDARDVLNNLRPSIRRPAQ